MPKRKRSEADGSPPPTDGRIGLQVTRLTNKFDYGVVGLSRALKTARGFERQKLGRREKAAKTEKNEETFARLEEEVRVLKALDVHVTAERYLFKQLVKTKRIAESPAFSQFSLRRRISVDGPKDVAEANVTARLFKSNPVKNVLPGIMDGIRSVLGLDEVPKRETGKKEVKDKHNMRETKSEQKVIRASLQNQNGHSAEDFKSESPEDDEDRDMDLSMDDAESLDFAQFDSRLASGSDSVGESLSGQDEDEARTSASEEDMFASLRGNITHNPADADDISDSVSRSTSPEFSDLGSDDDDDDDDDDDESDESDDALSSKTRQDTKKTTSKTKTQSRPGAAAAPPKDTTFLPSLMMGGYWSGSESGDEAIHKDGDEDDGAQPRRKNRMGQQARRALWEKKYGARANHVQKQQQQQQQQQHGQGKGQRRGGQGHGHGRQKWRTDQTDSRDSGWDVRKGATMGSAVDGGAGASAGGWGKGRRHVPSSSTVNRETAAADYNPKSQGRGNNHKKPDDDGKPLHPSWEAARRAKEQKAQASFQGKKIVFD